MRALALLVLPIVAAAPAAAKPLTVKAGESWVFSIQGGQPVRARKVSASSKPGPGQVLVTVRSIMGTTMTITSNNPHPYSYKAELVGAEKAAPARSCTLPANNRLSFENWPQTAAAVRLSDFRPAKQARC